MLRTRELLLPTLPKIAIRNGSYSAHHAINASGLQHRRSGGRRPRLPPWAWLQSNRFGGCCTFNPSTSAVSISWCSSDIAGECNRCFCCQRGRSEPELAPWLPWPEHVRPQQLPDAYAKSCASLNEHMYSCYSYILRLDMHLATVSIYSDRTRI